MASPNRYDTMH